MSQMLSGRGPAVHLPIAHGRRICREQSVNDAKLAERENHLKRREEDAKRSECVLRHASSDELEARDAVRRGKGELERRFSRIHEFATPDYRNQVHHRNLSPCTSCT